MTFQRVEPNKKIRGISFVIHKNEQLKLNREKTFNAVYYWNDSEFSISSEKTNTNDCDNLWHFPTKVSFKRDEEENQLLEFVCVNNYEWSIIMHHHESDNFEIMCVKSFMKFLCFMNECLTLSVCLFWVSLLLVVTCQSDLSPTDLSIHHLSLDMMWVMKCQRDWKINRVVLRIFILIKVRVWELLNESSLIETAHVCARCHKPKWVWLRRSTICKFAFKWIINVVMTKRPLVNIIIWSALKRWKTILIK